MKLIVGLGNPGKEYKNTRHNIGFMILDNYLGKVEWKNKMESQIYSTEINNTPVIFIKPQTYMNLSGLAVQKICNYYKISIENILIIQDDLDIELGKYKLKRNSSSGGHNGIKSIIKEIGSESFSRLKIGIGKSNLIPTDKYVLAKFTKKETEILESEFTTFNKIIEEFINNGHDSAINLCNKN